MNNNSSIRREIVKLIMLIISITIISALIVVSYFGLKQLRKHQFNKAKIVGELTTNNLLSAVAFADSSGAHEVLHLLKVVPNIKSASVYNENGNLICGFSDKKELRKKIELPSKDELTYLKSELLLKNLLKLDSQTIGVLKIKFSSEEFNQLTVNYIYRMLILGIILLALGFILALRMQKKLTQPILRLKDIAQNVRKKKITDVNVNVHSKNEIGILAKEFDRMLKTISKQEKERNEAIRAAKESKAKFKDLVDFLPLTVFEADHNLNITYINKHGSNTFELNSSSDILNRSIKNLFPEESENIIINNFKKVILNHKDVSFESKAITSNKKKLFVLVYVHSCKIEHTYGARGVIIDISERKAAEKNLMQAQKMETIGRLAGGIAHDFNNVLGGITGTLSIIKYLIEEKDINRNKIKNMLKLAIDSGERAKELVKQILTISRQSETKYQNLNLINSIKHVIKKKKNTFPKSINFDINLNNNEKAIVKADPTQLEQILLNLAVNASHAMTIMRKDSSDYGGTLGLELRKIHADESFIQTHPEADNKYYWLISIQDNGVGMSESTLQKIFDPFFTTKDKEKGTGLGLSIVYNIIQKHNGFIHVYSELNVGTTFNIYIPFLKEHEFQVRKEEESLQKYFHSGTVLVMDDEEIIRKVVKVTLSHCGYDTIFAKDGDEGMKLYQKYQNKIDLVILDMAMPKKSGKTCYYEIKNINPKEKILLTSGFKQDGRVKELLDKGISDFIQKPFTALELAKKVHQIITN